MFDDKQDKELVEVAVANPEATEMELELAERLQAAIEELDRMLVMLQQAGVIDGSNT